VHAGVRPGHDEPRLLGKTWNLEWLIFDMLALDPATAYVREFAELHTGVMSPQQIRDEACDPRTTFDRIKELYAVAKDSGFDDVTLQNEVGDGENLLAMLFRIGKERRGGPTRPAAVTAAETPPCEVAEAEITGLDPEDPWAPAVEALASVEDAETLLADVADQRGRGEIDPEHAALVEQAIEARFPDLSGASEPVAA
jgi:hypothetical protein